MLEVIVPSEDMRQTLANPVPKATERMENKMEWESLHEGKKRIPKRESVYPQTAIILRPQKKSAQRPPRNGEIQATAA